MRSRANRLSLGEHKHLFNVVRKDGSPESTIIGEGVKVPCGVATLVNGSMANLFIADGSRRRGAPFGGGHSRLLGGRGTRRGERKDLILAVVLGYEAMIRVGSAMLPGCASAVFIPPRSPLPSVRPRHPESCSSGRGRWPMRSPLPPIRGRFYRRL